MWWGRSASAGLRLREPGLLERNPGVCITLPAQSLLGTFQGVFLEEELWVIASQCLKLYKFSFWSNKPSTILWELWVFEFVIMGWKMIENISYGRATNLTRSNTTHNALLLPTLALMLEIYCYGNEGCCFSNCFYCSNCWYKMDWVNKVHFENLSLCWDLYQIKYVIRIGKFEIGT